MLKLDKIMEINRAAGQKDREAILDGTAAVTWGELEALTRRLVKHLAGKNYRRGLFLSANPHQVGPPSPALSTPGGRLPRGAYTPPPPPKPPRAPGIRPP